MGVVAREGLHAAVKADDCAGAGGVRFREVGGGAGGGGGCLEECGEGCGEEGGGCAVRAREGWVSWFVGGEGGYVCIDVEWGDMYVFMTGWMDGCAALLQMKEKKEKKKGIVGTAMLTAVQHHPPHRYPPPVILPCAAPPGS